MRNANRTGKGLSDRSRLLLWAGLISITLVILIVVLPLPYLERIQTKWIRFAVVTIVYIALSLKSFWRQRTSVNFWLIFVGFVFLHFMLFGYLFWSGNGLSLLTFGPAVGLEWGMLAVTVGWLLGVGPSDEVP